jgi:sugar diacid utilization regulator
MSAVTRSPGTSPDPVLEMAFRLLGAGGDYRDVAGGVVETARAIFDCPVAWLAATRPDEPDTLRMIADAGLRIPGLSTQWRLEVGEGVGGAVAATGKTGLIRDYRRDPRRVNHLKTILDAEELRSGLVVAVECGRPAVLYIADRDPRRFGEGDIPLAEALASAAGALLRGSLNATERARAGELMAVADQLQSRLAGGEVLGEIVSWLAHTLDGQVRLTGPDGTVLAAHQVRAVTGTRMSLAADGQVLGWIEIGGRLIDPAAVRLLGGAFALEIARRRVREVTTLALQADFVTDLISDHVDMSELRQRAGLLGFDLRAPRALLRVGVRAGRSASRPVALTGPLLRALEGELHRMPGVSALLPIKTDVWIVVPAAAATREHVAALLEAAGRAAGGLELSAGVGRVCSDPAHYGRSRADADLALHIARARDRDVVMAAELNAWRLLAPAADTAALRERAEWVLQPLLSADATHGRDDLATLRAWLANDRHRAKTAAALYVHENTVSYRIRRIGEILGVDLGDSEVRFQIELAVRTLELLDVP